MRDADLIIQCTGKPEQAIADAVKIAAKTGEEVQFKDGKVTVYIHPESYVSDCRSIYALKTEIDNLREQITVLYNTKNQLEKQILASEGTAK